MNALCGPADRRCDFCSQVVAEERALISVPGQRANDRSLVVYWICVECLSSCSRSGAILSSAVSCLVCGLRASLALAHGRYGICTACAAASLEVRDRHERWSETCIICHKCGGSPLLTLSSGDTRFLCKCCLAALREVDHQQGVDTTEAATLERVRCFLEGSATTREKSDFLAYQLVFVLIGMGTTSARYRSKRAAFKVLRNQCARDGVHLSKAEFDRYFSILEAVLAGRNWQLCNTSCVS